MQLFLRVMLSSPTTSGTVLKRGCLKAMILHQREGINYGLKCIIHKVGFVCYMWNVTFVL